MRRRNGERVQEQGEGLEESFSRSVQPAQRRHEGAGQSHSTLSTGYQPAEEDEGGGTKHKQRIRFNLIFDPFHENIADVIQTKFEG